MKDLDEKDGVVLGKMMMKELKGVKVEERVKEIFRNNRALTELMKTDFPQVSERALMKASYRATTKNHDSHFFGSLASHLIH